MWLTSLDLHTFRSYHHRHFPCHSHFNLFVAPNGAGKTNILEAIYLLGRGRSFRTADSRDLIKNGESRARVGGNVAGALGQLDIECLLQERSKRFLRAGKGARGGRLGLAVTLFSPEETLLLKGEPACRREYINSLIATLEGTDVATPYERILRQRNRLLKSQEEFGRERVREQLAGWDGQLAEYGARLVWARFCWLKALNVHLPKAYHYISKRAEPAVWRYEPFCPIDVAEAGVESVKAFMREDLKRRLEDELIRAISLVGPHRDEITALLGEREVKAFGSQGEHRSFVLALKLAEIALMEVTTGERPIFLLDDVGSELDQPRNRAFFEYLARYEGQVFITATERSAVQMPFPVEAIEI